MGIRRVHRQVCRRLRRRLNELGLETLEQYRGRLESDAGEWIVLDNLCHITISRFWRDKAVFDTLGNDILPELGRAARAQDRPVAAPARPTGLSGLSRDDPCGKDSAMKLYYAETLNPRKACAVAKHLGSPVEFVRIDLGKGENRSPRFLAINPNGKVPALLDGDRKLWEANAIMCYLAAKAGSDLWPGGERQIEVVRWLSWDASHFTRHAGTLYFQNIIKPLIGMGGPDPAVTGEATGYFRQFAGVLNAHLSGRDYLVGEGLTVADFAVAVSLPYAEKAKLPLDDFPDIRRWHARLCELPAWREPFPLAAAEAA